MRVSDGSSDVCSSDLAGPFRWLVGGFYLDRAEGFNQTINFRALPPPTSQAGNVFFEDTRTATEQYAAFGEASYDILPNQIGRASCRERVCKYVSNSVVAVALKKQTPERTIQKT